MDANGFDFYMYFLLISFHVFSRLAGSDSLSPTSLCFVFQAVRFSAFPTHQLFFNHF